MTPIAKNEYDIVFIGGRVIDPEVLQRAFNACIGTGDDSQSPVLRLMHKLAPELLSPKHAKEISA